jgi:hypothetical protein
VSRTEQRGRLSDRHRRFRDVILVAGGIGLPLLLIVAGGAGWPPAVVIAVVLSMVVNLATLCWLAWAVITRRVGLLHWVPNRPVGKRAAARRAQAEATAQQQRLEAALSHGRYRAETAEPPASDELTRARQELLEAIERHGGLSPQARAAAERAKRLRG